MVSTDNTPYANGGQHNKIIKVVNDLDDFVSHMNAHVNEYICYYFFQKKKIQSILIITKIKLNKISRLHCGVRGRL